MKNILVALDLTKMDPILIRYVSFLSKIFPFTHIHFMHAIEVDPESDEITQLLPDPEVPLEQLIREEIKSTIDQAGDISPEVETKIHIHRGDATLSILEWAEKNEIDLVLLGKKSSFRGTGIFSGKIVRLSHAAVLFIPEVTKASLRRILVPVDFSSHSQNAMRRALKLAKEAQATVFALHVYRLPSSYFPVVREAEKFSKRIIDQARKSYKKFLQKIDPNLSEEDVPCSYHIDDGEGIASHIYSHALSLDVDMIIIGSKGRTNAAAFLMGSVAVKLSRQDQHIPLLVEKPKEEQLSLVEALRKL